MSNPWLIVLIIVVLAVVAGECNGQQASARLTGDVDGDGQTTALDALLILQDVAGLRVYVKEVTVIDGDTIEVRLDGETERVRYYSIDAPELAEPGGQAARAANGRLTAQGVVLRPGGDGRDRDSYGRLLRRVFQPDGDWIEAMLVEGGYATWRSSQ